jgi:hypothetical protein
MGGSSAQKPKTQASPPQAEQLDYTKIMSQGDKQGAKSYKAQLGNQIDAYGKLETLQLGSVDKLASKLDATNNDYTKRATDQLIAAEGQATELGSLARSTTDLAVTSAQDLQGTDIERQLQSQAEGDLALGRSLSPEQERAATQQARAGMSARGLGTGTGALAAEVLNRDAYATQREAERRNFAGNTNQMLVQNRDTRLGRTGSLLGQAANTTLAQGNLRSQLAQGNLAVDPYARAIQPGLGIGTSTLGITGNMIGNSYRNATDMSGNVASFNANMLDSRWNTVQNNNASLQSSYMSAKASDNAANMGLHGAAMGASAVIGAAAAACWVARAAFGTATTRWVEYRRAMLRHASDRTIRLYCQHGQSIAAAITTPLRRLIARLTLRTLQWSWN